MLTNKQAVSRIKKVYNKSKYKEFDEVIGWYVDKETPTTYSWRFELDGKKTEIKCNKETGAVEVL
jgi:hypothetical protein